MSRPLFLRPLSYWLMALRRTWKADISTSFLTPTLYLASLGVGLGTYIDHGKHLSSLGGQSYLAYVAPALLATTAMQMAVSQSTYPVLGAVKWNRTYLDMMASPISVDGLLVGHLMYMALRLLIVSVVYLAVTAVFGAVHSAGAIGEILVGPLVGMAFATPLAAYAIGRRDEWPFAVVFRFVMVPLFLFSGTFFPLSQLPVGLRIVAEVLPLWHGVALCRALSTGHLHGLAVAGHVAYLVALTLVGYSVARVTYRRRLVT
jgi:lipooligosaccharide transport system permease protein